jgi:hypothetical protein
VSDQETSARPADTWRVCGRTLDQGCTCAPRGPSAAIAAAACMRLAGDLDPNVIDEVA